MTLNIEEIRDRLGQAFVEGSEGSYHKDAHYAADIAALLAEVEGLRAAIARHVAREMTHGLVHNNQRSKEVNPTAKWHFGQAVMRAKARKDLTTANGYLKAWRTIDRKDTGR